MYEVIKINSIKREKKIASIKSENDKEFIKAKRQRTINVLKNESKNIASVVSLALTNQAADILVQNKKLQKLVDRTNNIIESIKTKNDIIQAKTIRSSAISVINNNESKLLRFARTLETIRKFVSIFSKILNILKAIPLPVSVPPGIGIPMNVILKIAALMDKTSRILEALNVVLSIFVGIFGIAAERVAFYKSKLKEIGDLLDNELFTNSSDEDLESILLGITNKNKSNLNPTDLGEYKGFKFKLKEENDPNFQIRNKKRHYAVAIDKTGVERFKSDYSFTLDPSDLVEQLKIIIDQQNL